jgi:hypothetical protein
MAVWGGAVDCFLGGSWASRRSKAGGNEKGPVWPPDSIYIYLGFFFLRISVLALTLSLSLGPPLRIFQPFFAILLWVLGRSSLSSSFWNFFALALFIFVWMRWHPSHAMTIDHNNFTAKIRGEKSSTEQNNKITGVTSWFF